MFVLRSFFWLSTLVVLLPPAADGQPPPRVNVLHAAYATQVILQDITGVCERKPAACAASKDALEVLTRKLRTGAEIVSAGMMAGSNGFAAPDIDHGTLRPADLEPAWSLAEMRP